MPRPQIIVEVSAALQRRGPSTATGTAFFTYAGATGPLTPVVCRRQEDAVAASIPDTVTAWIVDCLTAGAPEVVVVRSAAVDNTAVTDEEWGVGLGTFTDQFGMGQVLIPGVSTADAHAALLSHAAATGRTALLDGPSAPVTATLATTAAGEAAAAGAPKAGFFTPWVTVVGAGNVERDVPGSVFAAALAARGDAAVGHANQAPMASQGRKAGLVEKGVAVTKTFTNDELDTLADAGISVFVMRGNEVTLSDWKSISDDERFIQLNYGRMSMEIGAKVGAIAYEFLGRQIDGRGHLFAELEGGLRGYLQDLWRRDALYGETADDAFEVEVASANTPNSIAAGELHAKVAVRYTPHTDKVVISVVTRTAEGA